MKLNLKKEVKESFDYLIDSKKYIYSIVILFVISVFIGFFVASPESLYQTILEYIQELLAQTEGLGVWGLISFIFWNNTFASFNGILLGIILGIFPIIATMMNGYLLGFVASMSVDHVGWLSLWRILPHGIFELPAIFIAFGLGLRLGLYVFFKNKKYSFGDSIKFSFILFVCLIVPLLIIAALIEGSLMFLLQ